MVFRAYPTSDFMQTFIQFVEFRSFPLSRGNTRKVVECVLNFFFLFFRKIVVPLLNQPSASLRNKTRERTERVPVHIISKKRLVVRFYSYLKIEMTISGRPGAGAPKRIYTREQSLPGLGFNSPACRQI